MHTHANTQTEGQTELTMSWFTSEAPTPAELGAGQNWKSGTQSGSPTWKIGTLRHYLLSSNVCIRRKFEPRVE